MTVTPTRSHPTLLPMTFDLCVHWLTCCLFLLFFYFPAGSQHILQLCILLFLCPFYTWFVHFFQLPLLFIPLFPLNIFFIYIIYVSVISRLFSFGFASVQTLPSVFARKLSITYLTPLHPTLFRLTFPLLLLPLFLFFVFFVSLGHQSSLCSPYDIIQCRLQPVYATVQVLVALDSASLDRKLRETVSTSNAASSRGSKCRSLVSVTTQTPPPAWQIWDLIGSSLLHILCLTLLFVAYSWIELT